MAFKVGDKVKIVKNDNGDGKYIGKTGYVKKVWPSYFNYPYEIKGINSAWCDEELEPVTEKQFTKSDLKERYLVKFRNGEECVIGKGKMQLIVNGKAVAEYYTFEFFNEDLTQKDKKIEFDIIEVYKPKYETIWTRPEEVKEMTIEEIKQALGYDFKLKGEK